jgi:class 3 adenylate cyclase/tetratricopeptide (TPR) repeat protein
VTCRTCGSALSDGARFCASCGSSVAAGCGSCGAELPPEARFCPTCGAPTEGANQPDRDAALDPTARERKVATLVFADLVGFTSLGEQHDPELVSELMRRVFERLAAEVDRYEGTVEKFAGDAILAVFGVPATHEDDPERAVRAALEMQAAMHALADERRGDDGPALALRIGVETGEVLADVARASAERDLFVTGDAVNTAARLQQTAEPGSVVVGPGTYAATRDLVEYEELAPTALKGKALAIAAWRAVTIRSRRGGRRAPIGLESPLIGREDESELLKQTMRRTIADRRPHLVTVLGAAGVGKSRLAWEFEKYLDGLPEAVAWRKGRCLSYGQLSFSALADVAKADIRALDDDPPDIAIARLDARLEALLDRQADAAMSAGILVVLGLGPANVAREDLFDAWRRYLEAIAAVAPLVLVLEDIHWADEGLLDFIEFLARWGSGPILILCLARHELLERRPAWGGGLPNAATIVLEPLDDEETGRLVDGLLAGGVPVELRGRILDLTGGNPLFAEELIRMFVDRGVLRFADGRYELARPIEEVEVPSSVHAVLAARLDSLPTDEKRVAQAAAVVGRIFWDAVLVHLARLGPGPTGELLRSLRVKELIVPREPSSMTGTSEFGFRHVLIRDVAYDSLAKRDRGALHLAVAHWAESSLGDRLDETVELRASHYLSALRYAEEFGAAPEVDIVALRAHAYALARRAGERAGALEDLAAAVRWLDVALELAEQMDLPPRERGALAEVYVRSGHGHVASDRMLAVIGAGLAALESLPDPTDEDAILTATLESWQAAYLANSGRPDEAERAIRESLAAADPLTPSRVRATLLARLGWLQWRRGDAEDGAATLEQAVEEARATGDAEAERWALHDLAVTVGKAGQLARAVALMLESERLAAAAGDRILVARSANNITATMDENGDRWARAEPIFRAGLERARRSGDRLNEAQLAMGAGDYLLFRGRVAESRPYYEELAVAAAALGDADWIALHRISVAWVALAEGDRPGGTRLMDEAAAIGPTLFPEAPGWDSAWNAYVRWPDDPHGALALLAERAAGALADTVILTGLPLARMALRVDDRVVLEQTVGSFTGVAAGCDGPVRVAQARWFAGLLGSPDRAVAAIAAAAEDLEAVDAQWPAADAYADAALIAERGGIDAGPYLAAARRLYDACGIVPLLGPLPETRWLAPALDARSA